ncbi:class I SAM-dependent methyltransferase [Nocardia sputi]|uniref:class I SAM-dependent methyltransferase n=1 Tax=Nocardia sputi TaxID=2943705 RepID=UPI0020BF0665|nr:SAM-dependent methyltransferase [Nocardia sputi]
MKVRERHRLMDNSAVPSRTALMAAAARAAHLLVDKEPFIFRDTFAYTLLGSQAEELIGVHRAIDSPILATARTIAATRSRYTEDALARSELRQYVVLGAGLDSYAVRCGESDLRIYEVDHSATQSWKRKTLEAAGIPLPEGLTFISADLASGSLLDRLGAAGLDSSCPAFVSWLGVTVYLPYAAIVDTVAAIGQFAAGSEVVVEHMLPADMCDTPGREFAEVGAAVASANLESWQTFLSATEMATLLQEYGFDIVRQSYQREMIEPGLWIRSDSLRPVRSTAISHARLPVHP